MKSTDLQSLRFFAELLAFREEILTSRREG
jgi:hypothetical protein